MPTPHELAASRLAPKRIAILGGGAREHALARKLSNSPLAPELLVLPGNPAIAREKRTRCLAVALDDLDALLALCLQERVDLTIVGPEAPLALGVVDRFEAAGLAILGPRRALARLESSKIFAKRLMRRAQIPTASWVAAEDHATARAHLLARSRFPCVIKADGLAGGKGSFIAPSRAHALELLERLMIQSALGEAGRHVVIEDYLVGQELSYIVLTDGQRALPLPSSQDYKRLGEHNTGGMGAISPSPHLDGPTERLIQESILSPLLSAIRPGYSGFLYLGLMLTERGPQVLEFNVRLGDPEAQAILTSMSADLLPALWAAAQGELAELKLDLSRGLATACVVSASHGYPGLARHGDRIQGLERAERLAEVEVYCGAVSERAGALYTAGGRVVSVVGRGATGEQARARAYAASALVSWPGMQRREDIG